MAEFCACGSLVINGHCTNKNCNLKSVVKSGAVKTTATKSSDKSVAAKTTKPGKTRKASKCIVYNLYDQKEENAN